jgi:hypothetical protein
LRGEPGGALRALDRSQRLRERPHGPQQDGGLVAIELAVRKSLRDGVDRNRRVGERDQPGEIEVERPMTQARGDAVHAGAQRRRVAVERAGDRRARQLASAVIEQLLGDDGGLVARSARASRRIAALAGLKTHVRFSFIWRMFLIGDRHPPPISPQGGGAQSSRTVLSQLAGSNSMQPFSDPRRTNPISRRIRLMSLSPLRFRPRRSPDEAQRRLWLNFDAEPVEKIQAIYRAPMCAEYRKGH